MKKKNEGKSIGIAVVAGAIIALGGCQSPIERSDPASKSARTTYGAISIVCSGDGAYCNMTLGDGAFTAADGDGATSTTASNDAAARLTAQVPGDALTAGIQAAAQVASEGIARLQAAHQDGETGSGECTGGECADGGCTGGGCSE